MLLRNDQQFILLVIAANILLCLSYSSVYETGYLQEYTAFRNALPYAFTIPIDANHAKITFRASSNLESCDIRKVQIQLQQGSLPLGKNETFPKDYYLDRTDVLEINFHTDNKTRNVDLLHPLPGDWFAIAYIPDKDTKIRPKGLFPTCYYKLDVKYTSSVVEGIDGIHLYHDYQVLITKPTVYRFTIEEVTSAYHVTIFGCSNSTGSAVNCSVDVLTRTHGVPDSSHYDNSYSCREPDQCVLTVPVLYQQGQQYIMFSATDMAFTFNISTTECNVQDISLSLSNKSCTMYPMMDRYEYQAIFKTRYTYLVNGTELRKPYTLSENTTLIVPYKVRSGADTGGSIVIKLTSVLNPEEIDMEPKVRVEACIHRTMSDRTLTSECPSSAAKLHFNTTGAPIKQEKVIMPYPKSGTWFATLSMTCFVSGSSNVSFVPCGNKTFNVTLEILADRCVEGQCNDKGHCAVFLQGRQLVSTCICTGGWTGYACNDGSDIAPENEQLIKLILLIISHVMFIPAVALAFYRGHYVEALVYSYTMFFSAFYHACDGGRSVEYKYCIIHLSVLSFCDFFGSITSIWVTLIAMAKLPQTIRSVMYVAGPLLLAMGIELERTSVYIFVIPGALGLLLIAISWSRKCYQRRKCYPPWKRYLIYLLPGLLVAGTGLCIFAFAENAKNYKYTHSAWHMLMATCTMFLLPPKSRKKEYEFHRQENGNCITGCLADDPNSTPMTRYRENDSTENLVL